MPSKLELAVARWATFAGLVASSLVLSGCVAPLRQEAIKTRSDIRTFRDEARERANYESCVAKGVLPGTTESLECQLELAGKEQPPKSQPPATP
ncbi:MAG: hypothetical protein ACREFW_02015 [Rhizomicrobium sp.]